MEWLEASMMVVAEPLEGLLAITRNMHFRDALIASGKPLEDSLGPHDPSSLPPVYPPAEFAFELPWGHP